MHEVLQNTRTILLLLTVASCTSTPANAATWDTTVPDYGSSAYERRNEQGKYYEGSPQYPYSNRSNVDRYNSDARSDDYARERDQEQARRNSQQDNRRLEPQDPRQDNRRNSCRSQYGAC